MIRDALPIGTSSQGLAIEIDEVDLAMDFEQRDEVEVIAIPRAEDAEPTRTAGQKARNPPPMLRESAPLIEALGVETELPLAGIVHLIPSGLKTQDGDDGVAAGFG